MADVGGVDRSTVGDEVFGWTEDPRQPRQYVAVPQDQLTHKPAELSWKTAGSLYVAGCTAWAAVQAVDARDGDTVRSAARPAA